MTATAAVIEQALHEQALGFEVFALGKDSKKPITTNGKDDAVADPDRARAQLALPAAGNYGQVWPNHGTAPVIAFDLDDGKDGPGGGPDWKERLKALQRAHGRLPETKVHGTPSGGMHAFFHWPQDVPLLSIDEALGFTLRMPGKHYCVGPGSSIGGKVYTSNGKGIADLPREWVEAIAAEHAPRADNLIVVGGDGYRLPEPGYTGSRYKAIRAYIASRYMRGVSPEEMWVGVRFVLAPLFAKPLPEPELRDRFERAWKGTPERLGEPLPPPRPDAPEPAADPTAGDWPELPEPAAYHGVLGDIARAVEPYTEADPVGILGTLLVMFGTACGDGRTFYQGSQQAPRLYVVLVGSTAFGGRKGTAYSVAADAFGRAYALDGLYVSGVASGEGITGHFLRHPEEPRALALETEFGRLLTIMNREGSTLSPVLRNAWDGVPLGHAKAREEGLVTRHHLSLLGHVTPPELRAKLTDADAANGFANRILWLAVRRSRLVPRPESPGLHVQPYLGRLHAAIAAAQVPREMTFDAEAAEAWDWFYAEMALTARLGLAGAITGRHEAQVARLALVYALADGADAIGLAHLEAAIALADYARRSAVWAFGDSTGNRHADVLRSMLADGPVGWSEAKRALGMRTAADMADVLRVLTDAGHAEVVDVPPADGRGRPRREIRAKGAKGAKGAGGARTQKRESTT